MIVVRQIQLSTSTVKESNISDMVGPAKELYNAALSIVQQSSKMTRGMDGYYTRPKILSGYDVTKIMRNKEGPYRPFIEKLPGQAAGTIIARAHDDYINWIRSLVAYKKGKEKFKKCPRQPNYKDEKSNMVISFSNQQCHIKDGILKFPKACNLELKTGFEPGVNINLRDVRAVKKYDKFIIEIVIDDGIEDEPLRPDNNQYMGIDLGVNNLCTIVDNCGGEPIIIPGGPLKSMNQYSNKKRAKLISAYDLSNGKRRNTKKYNRLMRRRQNKIKDYLHKVSAQIISIANERDICKIVIGENVGWKQEVNIGRINNQKFVSIPFDILKNMIEYKAKRKGIEVIKINESHTSKCDFIGGEVIGHHDEYMGNRVQRGLFISSTGQKINADVNGAYNILKKAIPTAFDNGIEGLRFSPKRAEMPF